MQCYYYMLCLVYVQGGYCLNFFLHCQNLACIQDYTDQEIPQLQNESCITVNSNSSIVYDYQLSQEVIYDYENGTYTIITLKGSSFSFPVETIIKYRYDGYHPIEDFVVDWVYKRVYLVLRNVLSGSIIKKDKILQMDDVISVNDVSSVAGVLKRMLRIQEVNIDPYRRYIFVLATGHKDSSFDVQIIVVRSDLEGKQLKTIIIKPLSKGYCMFYVDVNNVRLYVSINDSIYIYNYEGEIIEEIHLPYVPWDFIVFKGSLYFSVRQSTAYDTTIYVGNNVYEVNINQPKTPRETKNTYQLDKTGDCKIGILDARVHRQMENSKYLCDRTECPELCEVDSSGDNCVCFKTKAKTVDGIRCYTCGQSNLTSLIQQPTIINGQTSYPSNFPWHAVIYKISGQDQVCGGTLISSRAVLTAAHCVTLHCIGCIPSVIKPEELRVALGKTIRSWNITEPYETRRNVSDIIVHDNFMGSSTNYANDIALLMMDSEVSINNQVMPACLDYNFNQLPPHETLPGYVCGFGFTKDCGRSCSNYSNTLLYTIGTSINVDDCLKALNSKEFSVYHRLTSDKFCMGNGTVSPVQMGDSGGGLTVVFQGLHYAIGVVSVKLAKYDGDFKLKYSFSGFTNVSKHMNWIKRNIIQE